MSHPGEDIPGPAAPPARPPAVPAVALATVLREWGRIGFFGFGPAVSGPATFAAAAVDPRTNGEYINLL